VVIAFTRLIFLFICCFSLAAEIQVLVIDKAIQSINPIASLQYYRDPTQSLTIEDIISQQVDIAGDSHSTIYKSEQSRGSNSSSSNSSSSSSSSKVNDSVIVFQNTQKFDGKGSVLGFGYTSDVIWLKLLLQLPPNKNKDWLLEVGYPLLDVVELFVVDDGQLSNRYLSGDSNVFYSRPIHHRNFVFPINSSNQNEIKPSELTLYLKVQSSSSVRIPLKIWQRQSFYDSEQLETVLQGFYFGALISLFFYNLQIFFSMRVNAYRYYVLYVASYAVLQGALLGFNYQFLWPTMIVLNNLSVSLALSCVVFFVCRFTISFFNLRDISKYLYWVLSGLAAIGLLNLLLTFILPYRLPMAIGLCSALISVVVIIITGIYLWYWRKKKAAAYFTLAWLAFLMGSFLQILSLFQVLPDNSVTSNLAQIGSLIELLLLSFGLVEKFRHDREERQRVEREANKALIKLNSLLSETTEKLNVSNQIKTDFLSTISHELRTPMNGIIGALELLRIHINDQEADECFDIATESSARMMTMIDSILQFVSMQAESCELKRDKINVHAVFDELKTAFKTMTDGRPVIFTFDVSNQLSVVSDVEKLTAILKELLKNAYSYTNNGHIELGTEQSKQGFIGIFVKDTGCGIAPEKLQLIFESFSQVDQSMTRAHGGLGIGLALAKSFATTIRAEIEVESKVGEGSKFTVWLPNT
jgi:two-component system, sensor histidine kinase LadS